MIPRLVVVDASLSHGCQLYSLPWHGLSQLAPEGKGGEFPVDPDVGQEEDGGGQEELDAEDSDAVGQTAVLRAPVLHAVGALLDAESEDDVGSELDNVQLGVGDDGSRAESSRHPDNHDAGQTDEVAAGGPAGVEDHVVSVQSYQADGEGWGEAEEEREEHGELAERLQTGAGPGAGGELGQGGGAGQQDQQEVRHGQVDQVDVPRRPQALVQQDWQDDETAACQVRIFQNHFIDQTEDPPREARRMTEQ